MLNILIYTKQLWLKISRVFVRVMKNTLEKLQKVVLNFEKDAWVLKIS